MNEPEFEGAAVSFHRAGLVLAGVWAFAACVLGALAGSLGIAVLSLAMSWNLPPQSIASVFEVPYMTFAGATLANAIGFFPLAVVLWGYGRLSHRFPGIEGSWSSVAGSSAAIAAISCLGSGLAIGLALNGSPWLWIGGLALPIFASAFVGLVAARAIVPGLGPGAFLDPRAALGCLMRRPTRSVMVGAASLLLLTILTALAESEMLLPCLDLTLDSCFESVPSRGLPYPFWQRSFLPLAFVYDALVLATLPALSVFVVQHRRRAAE